jgi:hypothetical protein
LEQQVDELEGAVAEKDAMEAKYEKKIKFLERDAKASFFNIGW